VLVNKNSLKKCSAFRLEGAIYEFLDSAQLFRRFWCSEQIDI